MEESYIEGIALCVVGDDLFNDGAGACAEAVVHAARDDDDVVGFADAGRRRRG